MAIGWMLRANRRQPKKTGATASGQRPASTRFVKSVKALRKSAPASRHIGILRICCGRTPSGPPADSAGKERAARRISFSSTDMQCSAGWGAVQVRQGTRGRWMFVIQLLQRLWWRACRAVIWHEDANGCPDIAVFKLRWNRLTKCGGGLPVLLNSLRDVRCAAVCSISRQPAFGDRWEVVTPSSTLGLVKNGMFPVKDFQPIVSWLGVSNARTHAAQRPNAMHKPIGLTLECA